MKNFWIAAATAATALSPLQFATAQEQTPFAPFDLVGGWHFTNASTGSRFGGDIHIKVKERMPSGLMRSTVSYDGRQLNDICGTRGILTDDPVEGEVEKTSEGYRIVFMTKCVRGLSPRAFRLDLTCTDGKCEMTHEQTNGRGGTTLVERKQP